MEHNLMLRKYSISESIVSYYLEITNCMKRRMRLNQIASI